MWGDSQKENWKNKVSGSYSLLHLPSKNRAFNKALIKKKKNCETDFQKILETSELHIRSKKCSINL